MKKLVCLVMTMGILGSLLVGCGSKPEEAKIPSGTEYQPTTKLREPRKMGGSGSSGG
jgi:hypothetical protein